LYPAPVNLGCEHRDEQIDVPADSCVIGALDLLHKV
jgi:hypothetical protein